MTTQTRALPYAAPLSSGEPLIAMMDLSKLAQDTAGDFASGNSHDVFPERSLEYRDWMKLLISKLETWLERTQAAKPSADDLDRIVRTEFALRPKVEDRTSEPRDFRQ